MVVQQTAASAEESAASSEEMNAQCASIYQTVRELKIVIQGTKAASVPIQAEPFKTHLQLRAMAGSSQ